VLILVLLVFCLGFGGVLAEPELLFKSGFEEGVSISLICDGVYKDYHLRGGDEGFNWDEDMLGDVGNSLIRTLVPCAYDVYDYTIAELSSESPSSGERSLHLNIINNAKLPGASSNARLVLWPTAIDNTDFDEFYMKWDMKIPLSVISSYKESAKWLVFSTLFMGTSPIDNPSYTPVNDLYISSDYTGKAFFKYHVGTQTTYVVDREKSYDNGVYVPEDGGWHTYEFYFKTGLTDGRYQLKVDGQTALNWTGRTGLDVTTARIMGIYGEEDVSEIYVDDFEIWSGIPGDGSVDPCEVYVSGADWCLNCGPCSAGQGDCDSDAECLSGLICVDDVGEKYGYPASRDVCEVPVVEPFCGDGICDSGENCSICISDCGECQVSSKRYTSYKTYSNVLIDGDLSEFIDVSAIVLKNSRGSEGAYKFMWDDEYLYLSGEVSDDKLNSVSNVRDGDLWADDSFEVMFDTLKNGGSIKSDDYKFFVNTVNTIADSKGYDKSWNSEVESVVVSSGTNNDNSDADSGYVFEMKIPFSDLVVVSNNSVWGFNFVLNDDYGTGNDNVVWSGNVVNNVSGAGEILFVEGSNCVSFEDVALVIENWKGGGRSVNEILEVVGRWKRGC
jgi:hypothetical protein